MLPKSATILALVFASVLNLHAQITATISMTIDSSSTLELKGTSTLHNFECKSSTIQGSIEMDNSEKTFTEANIAIPVKSIHSGNSSMDDNMYDALKAKKNANITFSLTSAKIAGNQKTSASAPEDTVHGNLTIAGKTLPVDLAVAIRPGKNRTIAVEGTKDLLMTDFGVDPPSFMFGALKAGNKVTIDFRLTLAPANVQTATTSMK